MIAVIAVIAASVAAVIEVVEVARALRAVVLAQRVVVTLAAVADQAIGAQKVVAMGLVADVRRVPRSRPNTAMRCSQHSRPSSCQSLSSCCVVESRPCARPSMSRTARLGRMVNLRLPLRAS